MSKYTTYIFWIRSSRGTENIHITLPFPSGLKKDDIKDRLEEWCNGYGAWHVSENVVSYGWLKYSKAAQKKIDRYYKAKAEWRTKCNDFVSKVITQKQLNTWSKKTRKARQFPFK